MMDDNREGYPSYWTGSKAQGDNLPLYPNQERHISGRSKRGKDACSFTWWAMETMQQVKGGVGYHYADFSATL
ncbi:hypothetical protein TIFTF001_041561 [Ficus carica]|uniref:Uncharacterized protein n=2 Tax=Ficus carica TaxID=3494 RepID=A0AA88CTL3_FICCA|nr:hypothetical protein TIFTF001_041552 [Ficus carica]GMN31174.1 hypothetical protein TIFTF001_041555 [Ficus carica]GMN31188.1 hypothetical protein TIFTF001_041558 [Ficus carica]GMN31213.1 hypothetical protein TIFTF001_041561 [Ficus carica]